MAAFRRLRTTFVVTFANKQVITPYGPPLAKRWRAAGNVHRIYQPCSFKTLAAREMRTIAVVEPKACPAALSHAASKSDQAN
jgi:hypothetical protein